MNPKIAAALQYKPRKDSAPRLVAKGKGWIADRIIQIARENNIPLKEDPHLLEILSTLDLYEEIPPDLYKAVAEILIFLYKMNNKVLLNVSIPVIENRSFSP
jgi:flagellar biosynthesis protein